MQYLIVYKQQEDIPLTINETNNMHYSRWIFSTLRVLHLIVFVCQLVRYARWYQYYRDIEPRLGASPKTLYERYLDATDMLNIVSIFDFTIKISQ